MLGFKSQKAIKNEKLKQIHGDYRADTMRTSSTLTG